MIAEYEDHQREPQRAEPTGNSAGNSTPADGQDDI